MVDISMKRSVRLSCGVGGVTSVTVGKVIDGVPVVNVSVGPAVSVVPFHVWLFRSYCVAARMPATMKLTVSPAVQFFQLVWLGEAVPLRTVLTRIAIPPAAQGGELKRTTRGFAVGVITGALCSTRVVNLKLGMVPVPLTWVVLFRAMTTN